ncbi:MAG: LemA family protein [Alphaproteobacteria bacterium]|nr:LemA family protein [Alphaproteobacteria bacterium]MCK5659386.1 LemA family protein [Alphaproteobacteria bacterium]
MNKNIITVVSFFAIVAPILFIFMFFYNGLVSKEEDVMSAWAQVEANYQRRADLIPNLVETVQGFAEHEKSVLTAVTESRAKVMSIKANPNDQASVDSMMRAQANLGRNLTMLMATVENYPQLRSADNFRSLQDQLEGTENRINTSRMVFNETVNDYNASIRKMPGAVVAGFGNFHRKAYFKSETGSEKVVGVDFNKE